MSLLELVTLKKNLEGFLAYLRSDDVDQDIQALCLSRTQALIRDVEYLQDKWQEMAREGQVMQLT